MRLATLLLLAASSAASAQSASSAAHAEGRFVRALTALAIEDFETAQASLDEVLAGAPDDPTVLAVRAEVALSLQAPADAVFFARRATEAAPGRADAWLAFAHALRAAGQPDAAADALDRARSLAPADPDVLTASADLAAARGDDAAERDALAALVRVGDTVAARLRLSVLAERLGDRADALAHARAAERLAPTEPAVQRRLADLADGAHPPDASTAGGGSDGPSLFAAGRFSEAADALIAEIDADPRQVGRWALALQALARTADPRAGATADDALLLFPSVPSVLVGAAEAFVAAGRTRDARDAARRAGAALDLLGDDLPDAPALRARLDALPSL